METKHKYEITISDLKFYADTEEEMNAIVAKLGFDMFRAKIYADPPDNKLRWWIDKEVGYDILEVTEL